MLVHHEIRNDTVDGDPVAVTYCPLTGTAMGFERGETTVGVSGRLLDNNRIMYDRGTEFWWPQVLASSIPGPWNDATEPASLGEFRVVWTTWKRWRNQHPDTRVLTGGRNAVGDYGSDPYGSYNPRGGYYAGGSTTVPRLNPEDRLGQKRVFVGARTRDGAAAFPKDRLREQGTVSGELGGNPVVAVHDPLLGTAYVYHNPAEATVTLEDGRARLGGSGYDPDALPLERL